MSQIERAIKSKVAAVDCMRIIKNDILVTNQYKGQNKRHDVLGLINHQKLRKQRRDASGPTLYQTTRLKHQVLCPVVCVEWLTVSFFIVYRTEILSYTNFCLFLYILLIQSLNYAEIKSICIIILYWVCCKPKIHCNTWI